MGANNPPSAVLFGGGNQSASNISPNGGELDANTGRYRLNDGPFNLIGFNNFENGLTTGWSLGTTGTLTNGIPTGSPTFGSGTTNLTLGVTTSSPLFSSTSLTLTAAAATTAGNMFSTDALPVPVGLQGKVISWNFPYQATANASNGNFSGTSSNSFGVAIYDVTNSAWIGTAGQFNIVQSSGTGNCTGTAQLPINTTSIRFMVYCANATAGAITMAFDQFYLGPQVSANAPAMSDWVAYTPTITGFGTPANVSFRSRRVGDSLEVLGFFQSGTATAVTSAITIGYNGANANVSIDNTKLPADPINSEALVGGASVNSSSTTLFNWTVLAPTTSSGTTVNLGLQSSTVSGSAASNGSVIVSGTQSVELFFTVPIVGWSSNTVSSADTDTRVIATRATGSSTALTSSPATVVFPTVTYDLSGSYNASTGIFTVPVTGKYKVSTYLQTNSVVQATAGAFVVSLFKNGSSYSQLSADANKGTGNSASVFWVCPGASDEVSCNAGDTLNLSATSGASVSLNSAVGFVTFERLSGPAVIQATESVNARYHNSATAISGSLATVVWTTKDFDSHNAMSSGVYTCPIGGKFQVNCAIITGGTFSLNNSIDVQIQKNGVAFTEQTEFAFASATDISVTVGDIINCNAGDTIQVQLSSSAVASTITSSNTKNWFSIARVGN